MKRRFSKILSLVLAAVVAFGTFAFSTGSAYAAGCELALDDTIWLIDGVAYGLFVHDSNWNEKTITAATVSNKSIATIRKSKYDGETWWGIEPRKAGKVKITVTYKTKSGKQKLSKTVRVKKYPNQIKSLTINGKKVSTKKYQDYYDKKFTGTSVKVKAALKSTWKMTNNTYCYVMDKNGKDKTIKVSKSKILKGQAISFAKKYKEFYLYFEMQNKSNGDTIGYSIRLHR